MRQKSILIGKTGLHLGSDVCPSTYALTAKISASKSLNDVLVTGLNFDFTYNEPENSTLNYTYLVSLSGE